MSPQLPSFLRMYSAPGIHVHMLPAFSALRLPFISTIVVISLQSPHGTGPLQSLIIPRAPITTRAPLAPSHFERIAGGQFSITKRTRTCKPCIIPVLSSQTNPHIPSGFPLVEHLCLSHCCQALILHFEKQTCTLSIAPGEHLSWNICVLSYACVRENNCIA